MTPAPFGRAVAEGRVPRLALGTAGMGLVRGDRDRAIATLCAAFDAGVRVVDTAAAYVPHPDATGFAEELVRDALAAWDGDESEIVVVTKAGHARVGVAFALDSFATDGSPAFIRTQAERSVEALGRPIDVLLLHWPDPNVPLGESVGALAELAGEGLTREIGLSNVTREQFEQAAAVAPISVVQNPRSPFVRGGFDVVAACADDQAAFMAYSPLGSVPRASSLADALPAFGRLASALDVSVPRLVLAWLLRDAPIVVPVSGASRIETVRDSIAALALAPELTEERLAELNASLAVRSPRGGP